MFVLSGSLTPVSLSHPQLLRRAGSFPGVNPPGAAAESSPDSSGRLGAGFTGSSKCWSPKGDVGTEPRRGQPQKHLVWPREPTGRAQHPPVQALPFPEHPPKPAQPVRPQAQQQLQGWILLSLAQAHREREHSPGLSLPATPSLAPRAAAAVSLIRGGTPRPQTSLVLQGVDK